MSDARPIRFMFAGRLLALAVLLACLFAPGNNNEFADLKIVVLIDRSDFEQQENIESIGNQIKHEIVAENSNLDVSVSVFGGALAAMGLEAALEETLWQLQPGFRNRVLIASSGYWSSSTTDRLGQISEAGISVYWLPLDSGEFAPRIISVNAPPRARPGQIVNIMVAIEATNPTEYVVELFSNGVKVAQGSCRNDGTVTIPLLVAPSGSMQIDAVLVNSQTSARLDEIRAAATINIASTTRLLAVTNAESPLTVSLASGGWDVTRVSPDDLNRLQQPISTFSAVILDNIAVPDVADSRWLALTEAVRRDAVGLLVLGGPDSFGLGAYRDSILERLLPVVSEPPESTTPAAVVFVVDRSGSMGGQSDNGNGLSAARDAAGFAAAALRPTDRVGLIAFDVEAQQLLEPDARDDHVSAIRGAWPTQASGGTSIGPALDLAATALAADAAEQKMMFMLTDGMLADEDLEQLKSRSTSDDFEMVAMIVADKAGASPASRLELSDNAAVLIIDDVLRLPQLLRNELEHLRAPVIASRTVPRVISPMPMQDRPDAWPSLDAYVVTRPRRDAAVMLADDSGAPFAATWVAGSGRVVTLSGGLNEWASDWLEWSRWPDLVTGLVDYVAVRDAGASSPKLQIDAAGHHAIVVNETMSASPRDSIAAILWPPAGDAIEISLKPHAPGRFRAPLILDQQGEYTLAWASKSGTRRHSFVNTAARVRRNVAEPPAGQLLNEGVLREWSSESAAMLKMPVPWRTILIVLSALLLLATIAEERMPIRQKFTSHFASRNNRARQHTRSLE